MALVAEQTTYCRPWLGRLCRACRVAQPDQPSRDHGTFHLVPAFRYKVSVRGQGLAAHGPARPVRGRYAAAPGAAVLCAVERGSPSPGSKIGSALNAA